MKQLYNSFLTNQQKSWNIPLLFYTHTSIVICLILWFCPLTHDVCQKLDADIFFSLNKTLSWSTCWQKIMGILNHPNEARLNVFIMVGVNILAIFSLEREKRLKVFLFVLYFWFFIQIGLFVLHAIFSDLLEISRDSPTLVLTPFVKLSEVLSHPVKDHSSISLPAGHTFAVIYWAGFTLLYIPKKLRMLIYLISICLILPRLFSGAHWASDVVFTTTISLAWLAWAISTPLYPFKKPLPKGEHPPSIPPPKSEI